jgi:transcriptional regulator with XRE-family HTH domain
MRGKVIFMDMIKTGQLIAGARKEKGLTQQQLAEALNITGAAVSKWERGLSFPDVSILEALSAVLDISVIELLRGEWQNSNLISKKEAEESVRDAIHLIMDDLNKNPVPESVRRFFAPNSYQTVIAIVFFIVGICLGITGGVTFLGTNGLIGIEMSIIGLFLLIVSALFWIWGRTINVRNRKLVTNGVKVNATAIKISQHYFTDMPFQKNSHPYYIAFEYVVDGRIYKGRSPLLWEQPQLKSKSLTIYIDPNYPQRHYLDLTLLQ